jgi:hypothetical protein
VPPPPPPPVMKECCICFLDVQLEELLLLYPCAHRCVCEGCADALMLRPAARRLRLPQVPQGRGRRVARVRRLRRADAALWRVSSSLSACVARPRLRDAISKAGRHNRRRARTRAPRSLPPASGAAACDTRRGSLAVCLPAWGAPPARACVAARCVVLSWAARTRRRAAWQLYTHQV